MSYDNGRYFGRITNQALGKASTGNPQIALRFLVVGKMTTPTAYEPVDTQEERSLFMTITDKTADRIGNDLATLGFAGTSFRQIDPSTSGHHDFTDTESQFYCKHEEYNGKDQERWSVARQGGGMPDMKPLEAKELRDLDNLFGKHLKKGTPKQATQQASASAPSEPPPMTDEDVPF